MRDYNKENADYAKELRKNMTPWEKKLWYDCLRGYRVRFQRQKRIGNYIADFYCARASLVIELDGSPHYEERGKRHDAIRDAYMREQGIEVIRICDLEIDKNFYFVCRMIDEVVQRRVKEFDNKKKKEWRKEEL